MNATSGSGLTLIGLIVAVVVLLVETLNAERPTPNAER
jgi:hypothetical protein